MAERRCEGCGGLIPSTARMNQRHCAPGCRVIAHRRSHAPPAPLPFRDFARLVAGVDADRAEVALVAGIFSATGRDWRSAAWLLERLAPTRYGPQRLAGAADDLDYTD